MLSLMQITFTFFILTLTNINAKAPPGYIKPPEVPDEHPPKYEYGYNIEDEKGTGQGKLESRDGIYALGRYYVQGTESSQNVQYFADDWGYHPYVEYSSVGPHSKTRTQLVLGAEAVKALRESKSSVSPKQQITETIDKINQRAQTAPTTVNPQFETKQPDPIVDNSNTKQPQQVILSNVQPTQQVIVDQNQAQPQPQILINVNSDLPQQATVQNNPSQQPLENRGQNIFDQDQTQQVLIDNKENQIQQVFIEPNTRAESITGEQQVVLTQPQEILHQDQPTQQNIIIQQNPNNIFQQGNEAQTIQENLILNQALTKKEYQSSNQEQIQNYINQQQGNSKVLQNQPLETAALYETSNTKVIDNNQEINTSSQEYDGTTLSLEQPGDYGSKINAHYIIQTNIKHSPSTKLIQTTKNLISGEDVLKINGAVTENVDSTVKSSISTEATLLNSVEISHSGNNNEYTTTTISPPLNENSFANQPIIVADLDDRLIKVTTEKLLEEKQSSEEVHSSTTGNTIETISLTNFGAITEPSPVLVTPRPVSSNFLAPITAGIQLQGDLAQKQKYFVEIQQSLPYYLGKYEYVQNPQVYNISQKHQNEAVKLEQSAVENIELGKTLLFFPGEKEQPKAEFLIQQLPKFENNDKFFDGENSISIQQLPSPIIKKNFIEINNNQYQNLQEAQSKSGTTKIINEIYGVPLGYEKNIPAAGQVEKVIQKPVTITRIVEKPVSVPYPVEKIVERPIHVPVEVTRYIDRPYPVQVPVAHPVPYPVDRIVEKIVNQPYPVEVRVPVEVKVPVPQPVPVEKIVEKKIAVPQYIEKIVEKPVPHYIDRPYPVEVKVPTANVAQSYILPYRIENVKQGKPYLAPHPYPVNIPIAQPIASEIKVPVLEKYSQNPYPVYITHHTNNDQYTQQQQQQYFYATPYVYAPTHANKYLPPKSEYQQSNDGYLPPLKNCDQDNSNTNTKNVYSNIKTDDYIGLLPPKLQNNNLRSYPRKFRNARSNFNTNNLRIEYGFMPPLIPSLEIDEQGQPIDKSEK